MATHNKTDIPYRIDVAEADKIISSAISGWGTTHVPLAAASGCILQQKIFAERDQPPFDRATMDGIAVSSTALANGIRRFIRAGVQAAGAAEQTLPDSGHCFEVMTGAVMPAGADTVIPVERISSDDDSAEVSADYDPQGRQFVHRRASDHREGALLLDAGTIIDGPTMAILTAAGEPEVAVARYPSVAVVSTGDELVDVGLPMAPFQIRSSNDRAIETCLRQRGFTHTFRSHLPDDPDALRSEISELHRANDVLILSGGVSMGKYDYVPAILEELGVEVRFHKILQRPGLPMWFGLSTAGKPVFALPGNPVSTLVCCVRYVLPALLKGLGAALPTERVQLAETVSFAPDLTWFLPVKLEWTPDGQTLARPCPTNTSGDFIGLRGTDGVVELPRGQSEFPQGFAAKLLRW